MNAWGRQGRLVVAACLALALAGVSFALPALRSSPEAPSVEPDVSGGVDGAPIVGSAPRPSDAAPEPIAPEFSTIDADVLEAAASDDAPALGVPSVLLAEGTATSDPALRAILPQLVHLGGDLYAGDLTATDLVALTDVPGLKVSLDRPLTVEPPPPSSPIEDLDSPFKLEIDSISTVAEVDPLLASTRSSLGLQGSGQVIAIVDTGVDTNALGLSGKVNLRVDFSSPTSCSDGGFLDPIGHGTHVASIAAGSVTAADPSIVGVAPGAKVLDLRVFNCAGSGSISGVDTALQWVLTNRVARGITVVNLSLGSTGGILDGTDTTSILVNKLVASGVFVSVSSGNSGDEPSTIGSPGTAQFATTVGAASVSRYGAFLAPYSSQGPVAGRNGVDIVAAGSSIRAAKSTANSWSGTTTVLTGTSMAAPYIAGLAALLRQKTPSHAPSGTLCTTGPLCPEGVIAATMTNGIESDMSTSDWFTAGPDPFSGRGLVSASNSLRGLTTPAAASATGALASGVPMMVSIPAHAAAVSVTVVTDTSVAAAFGDLNAMNFTWVDERGATSAPDIPCNMQIVDATYCIRAPLSTTQRVWNFTSPASDQTTWLRLESALPANVFVTVPGMSSGVAITGGLDADDVTLDGTGSATVTVQRTVTSASATTLNLVSSGGLEVPASVILPAGSAGTSVAFAVTEGAGFAPVAPNARGRVTIASASGVVLVVGVGFASPESVLPGQVTVGGDQIHAGNLVTGWMFVTTNGSVVGASIQPDVVRIPGTWSNGPFVVAPDSNDAVPVPLTQTVASRIDVLGSSADADRLLLLESGEGSGLVSGDTDSRDVIFVHRRSTDVSTEIGTPSILPGVGSDRGPKISEDGLAVGFVAPTSGGASALYWQGGVSYGDRRTVATFSNSETALVLGVTETTILVQYTLSGSTFMRLYSTPANTFVTVGAGGAGNASLSSDGTAVAYIGSADTTIKCWRASNGVTTTFSLAGHWPESTFTAGPSCAYVVGVDERVPTFPEGWGGLELVRIASNGTRTVLASSTDDAYWWTFDSTGTQVVTWTAAALSDGDTNGLTDVYRGTLAAPPALLAPVPTIAGIPYVGSTLTANPGSWSPGPASLTYQWFRGGTLIAGAVGKTYQPVVGDVGSPLSVKVTGTTFGRTPALATSAATRSVGASIQAFVPAIDSVSPSYGTVAGGDPGHPHRAGVHRDNIGDVRWCRRNQPHRGE